MLSYLNKWLLIDPVTIVKTIISNRAVKNQIEKWNREQLLDGKNSLDVKLSDIGGNYSTVTLSLHPEKVADRINLFDTGEFHKSIEVKLDKELFEIVADPIKQGESGTTNLYSEWGVDIIGLNDENLQKLIEEINDKLIIEILKTIQLN